MNTSRFFSHGKRMNARKVAGSILPVIHIGFLDYTLFEEYPEFYATYKLVNVDNQHIYSDKMTLSVVDLSKIDLASDIDKAYHIDQWAALFKATTWEELQMIADKSEYLAETSQTIFQLSADEQIRKICQDREEYYLDIRCYQEIIAKKDNVITEKDNVITEKDNIIAEKDDIIKQLHAEIASLTGR